MVTTQQHSLSGAHYAVCLSNGKLQLTGYTFYVTGLSDRDV
jgi:hypothetical protein